MNKSCARCEKVVYPIEELKCLDKSWHKACFKCAECNMTLNLKTYKGYNKLPYCAAHIPKAKATAIADTPELKRIAENTKIQSNVKYHEDFEKAKGKFTQVADDPETLRIKQNTKIISNVAYHGDLERKAAMERQREISEVSDYQGINKEESLNYEYFSETLAAEQYLQYASKPQEQHNQQQQHQQYMSKPLTMKQEVEAQTIAPPPVRHQQPYTAAIIQSNQAAVTQQQQQHNVKQMRPQQQHVSQYNTPQSVMQRMPVAAAAATTTTTNYQQQQFQTQRYDYGNGSNMDATQSNAYSQNKNNSMTQQQYYNGNAIENNNVVMANPSQYLPPVHTNMTAVNDNNQNLKNNNNNNNNRSNYVAGNNMAYDGNTAAQDAKSNTALGYMMSDMQINSNGNMNRARSMQNTNTLNKNRYAANEHINVQQQNYMYPTDKKAVYNAFINDQRINAQQPAPVAANQSQLYQHQKLMQTPSQNQAYYHHQQQQQQQQQQQMQHQQQQQQQILNNQSQMNAVVPQQQQQTAPTRMYRALYDYEAQDTDEVSFREGDLIYEVDAIDSGWLTGHVARTGESGMLPANYVETATI